jgi:hypothetical protein
VLLACAFGGASLAAEDAVTDPLLEQVVALEKDLAKHVQEKAAQPLLEDAKRAADLHKQAGEKADLKKRLLAVQQSVVRNVKEDAEKKAALDYAASTGDENAASIIKPFLRQPNVKEADDLLLGAIAAAGRVPSKDTVDALLKIVENTKHMGAGVAAMKSLASFGKLKAPRVKVLQTLVDIVEPLQPGGRPGARGSGGGIGEPGDSPPSPANQGDPAARWASYAPVLPDVLNALTGQKCSSAQQWFQMVKEAKPNFQRLFLDS